MSTLRSRIRGGESATLEYKSKVSDPSKLARTLAAFANGAGGTVFVGVSDRGEIIGVEDREAQAAALEAALTFLDPQPEHRVEQHVHELKDVLAISIEPVEFPEFCVHDHYGEETLYFRVQAATRPVDRETERAVVRLRKHMKGERRLSETGQRLLDWLWDNGEALEGVCCRRINYSKGRLRKLMEELIGGGYVVPCNMGQGRTYVAIAPGPGVQR